MMRLRKIAALVVAAILLLTLLTFYTSRELTVFPLSRSHNGNEDFENNKWLHFEHRIKRLEEDFSQHHDAVNEIRDRVEKILQPKNSDKSELLAAPVWSGSQESCTSFQDDFAPQTDIQMLDVYKTLSFDNIDGGVWKQGWPITVNDLEWNAENKLRVFVVPHSHNDPGWLKTVDEYYVSQTKHILNNMLKKLPVNPKRRFIWAEISYFSMWWEELEETDRTTVKQLLADNQLEIVTGGWVMNDEANSHWLAVVHQLTEGHQWLRRHLNYTPTSSWSIDPFGMSATQPLLLNRMQLRNALIQRTHYSVKKHLARNKQLEFRWRQLWDGDGQTDLFTHMMPFYSYDVPHTCGPDPKVCCQFDFRRLANFEIRCPWKVAPKEITEHNVAERAALLLDQYRKKSKLFNTNVLLVPLGDDFRFNHTAEWDVQFENYEQLFAYMNANSHLNVEVSFGTLTDYFNSVEQYSPGGANEFPTLSGDFFTYADRDDHYWSGYYTSRPFYKRMDRVLLSYIRASEMALFLAVKHQQSAVVNSDTLESKLTDARRALALFQHHDGITGTARDHVVVDYAKRMWEAIRSCQYILQACVNSLLMHDGGGDQQQFKSEAGETEADSLNPYYFIDDIRANYDAIGQHVEITFGTLVTVKKIAIFNPLTYQRIETVTFNVNTPNVEVWDEVVGHNARIPCQISPIFGPNGASMLQNQYHLSFVVTVAALSIATYTIRVVPPSSGSSTSETTVMARISIYNQYQNVQVPPGFSHVSTSPSATEFSLQSGQLVASFSKLGLLKAVKSDLNTVSVHLDFVKYGARASRERSGAYLFLPDGNGTLVPIQNTIVCVIRGPIMSSVTIQLPHIRHTVRLFNNSGASVNNAIHIENIVDIPAHIQNLELGMRVSTHVRNRAGDFFTDANVHQMMRRKRHQKLPLQANYYPVPSAIYIEDDTRRVTLLTGTPLGGSSLRIGEIEVMLDRRLNQDDNLGLGQGVQDNVPIRHLFQLMFESRHKINYCAAGISKEHPAGFLTLAAHTSLQSLLNPLVRLLRNDIYVKTDEALMKHRFTAAPTNVFSYGVDVQLASIRSDLSITAAPTKTSVGFTVQRQHLNLCYATDEQLKMFPLSSNGTFSVAGFRFSPTTTIYTATLSFLKVLERIPDSVQQLAVCPMDIRAFIVH